MIDLYLQSVAVMLLVVLACRCSGLTIGIVFAESSRIRRVLDVAPSCAIGAVLGPNLASASISESLALIASVLVFLCTARFVLSLVLAVVLLVIRPTVPEILSSALSL